MDCRLKRSIHPGGAGDYKLFDGNGYTEANESAKQEKEGELTATLWAFTITIQERTGSKATSTRFQPSSVILHRRFRFMAERKRQGCEDYENELDLVSDFIPSMYAWEFVRGNLDGKKTTDSDKDNDVFLAEISGAVDSSGRHYPARRQNEAGNNVGGLIAAETAFNLSLLPKRNLLRNAARIAVGLHLDDTELKFQTLEQNTKISTKLSSLGLVVEKLNEYIRNFGAPPFLPIYLEFTSPVPRDFLPRSAANPYGRISAETCRTVNACRSPVSSTKQS